MRELTVVELSCKRFLTCTMQHGRKPTLPMPMQPEREHRGEYSRPAAANPPQRACREEVRSGVQTRAMTNAHAGKIPWGCHINGIDAKMNSPRSSSIDKRRTAVGQRTSTSTSTGGGSGSRNWRRRDASIGTVGVRQQQHEVMLWAAGSTRRRHDE